MWNLCMVNFDNFFGLTSVLKFHIFFIFNCEELVLIRTCHLRRTGSIFSDVKNWYSIFTNVKNRYQFFTPNSFEIWPEVFDKISECFLLVYRANRFLHKVEIFEQIWKGIDQPKEEATIGGRWKDGWVAGRTDILWPQRALKKGSTIQSYMKLWKSLI